MKIILAAMTAAGLSLAPPVLRVNFCGHRWKGRPAGITRNGTTCVVPVRNGAKSIPSAAPLPTAGDPLQRPTLMIPRNGLLDRLVAAGG